MYVMRPLWRDRQSGSRGGRIGPGGLLGLQNQCDPPLAGRVGSIPSRSRHIALARGGINAAPTRLIPALLLALSLAPLSHAHAQQQDSARAGISPQRGSGTAARTAARDSLRPPISPVRAMLYSFALPGLGQAKLDRPYAAAFFFSIEAVSIAMARQAIIDRNYAAHHVGDSVVSTYQVDSTTGIPVLDSTGHVVPQTFAYNRYTSDRLGARRLHVEDWIAALIFNHLFSGADAFVAAQLWDLPGHVQPPKFEAYREPGPRGRTILAVSVPAPR